MTTLHVQVTDHAGHTAETSLTYTVSTPDAADLSVRVFPHRQDLVYREHAAVLKHLAALGVRRIHGLITPSTGPKTLDFYRTFAAMSGGHVWLTVGEPRVPLNTDDWNRVRSKALGLGCVERVYGWNEPNNKRSPGDPPLTNWVRDTVRHQRALAATFAGTGIDVGTFQLWSGNQPAQFDHLAALMDFTDTDGTRLRPGTEWTRIAWHWYIRPRGGVFDPAPLDVQESRFRAITGDQASPIDCTETGLFTAPNYTGGAVAVTEEQQAALLAPLVGWYRDRGYGMNYFELLDQPDPSGRLREASFGLVRTPTDDPATWTRKPAFSAFRDLVTT